MVAQLNKLLALIVGETKGFKSKLTSLRMSSQEVDCISVGCRALHRGIEEIYVKGMTHEETFHPVHELTSREASSKVKPD